MRNLWREYGLIVALIVVAMAAYLVYNQHRERLLASSLDLIGSRLVAMVEGSENHRGTVARLFDQFKKQVLQREVTPVQVEYVAANVLNLSSSGAKLTPEEVRLVLEPALASVPDAVPATPPAAPAPSTPSPAPSMADVGRRIGEVLAFETRLRSLLSEDPALHEKLAGHIQFHFDGGLRVVIDEDVPARLTRAERERFLAAVRALEEGRRVRWEKHLADALQAQRARTEAERLVMEGLHKKLMHRAGPSPGTSAAVATPGGVQPHATASPQTARHGEVRLRNASMTGTLALMTTLKRLEALGYLPPAQRDSVHQAVQQALQPVLAFADSLATGLAHGQDPARLEETLRNYEDHLERYFEAYEAKMNAHQRLDSLPPRPPEPPPLPQQP
ncbi:hypothetical protein GQ464_008685 [Rhodocaloribacter litoris]|uniref:hypothetical protein n=1 Tax=Rhodocaloribacter litoris TaxID=2558931 RepID=UPI00141FA0FB|nr:hypothetical protein [Rhodocaloribacter litoris]QXD16993.1 hypothetical protein GQ464_008685 [Rhodocaloribacter litoris]